MENNKNSYKEERFDSFLNKTIIMSSRTYFKKQMNIIDKERTIVDDENFCAFLQTTITLNTNTNDIDNIETTLQVNNALKSLSEIEQAVIFLLFHEDLTQNEVAKMLKIYSKTVSKIKLRAIDKLKKTLKGEWKNEK